MSEPGRTERAATRGNVIAQVGDEVEQRIAAAAAETPVEEPARIQEVAGKLRGSAIEEVVRGERDVTAARILGRISQVADYLFFLVYGLLTLRFVLALLAARSSAGFVRFVDTVTDPLYEPFRGIVRNGPLGEGHVVVLSVVVALVVYVMAHLALRGLFRLIAHRSTL